MYTLSPMTDVPLRAPRCDLSNRHTMANIAVSPNLRIVANDNVHDMSKIEPAPCPHMMGNGYVEPILIMRENPAAKKVRISIAHL